MTDRATFVPDLMIVLTQLTDLVDSENHLLTIARPAEIAPLMPEKSRLAAVYGRMSAELRRDRTLLAEAGAETTEALRALAARLDEGLAVQSSKLEIARHVTEGLISAVGKAVVERKQPVLGYGRDMGLRTAVSGGASFALNQNV